MALKSTSRTYDPADTVETIEFTTGNVESYTNNDQLPMTLVSNRIGNSNPYYKDQIARVVNATTYLSGTKWTVRNRGYQISEFFSWSPSEHPNSWRRRSKTGHMPLVLPLVSVPPELVTKATNRAKQEFVSKIRDKQTAFQGGTFLGEIGQTISLIKRRGKQARRTLQRYTDRSLVDARKVRKIRKRALRIKDLHERLSNNWLETQFGWLTLLRESDDLIRALAESRVDAVYPSNRVTGFGEAEQVDPFGTHSPDASLGFSAEAMLTRKYHVKYSGVVGAGSSAVGYAARTVGLGPSNWLPTAWELVPYSFVADYFTNIGDIINAYSLASSSLRWAYRTSRFESTVHWKNFQPVFYEPRSGIAGPYQWQQNEEYAVRPEFTATYTQVTRDSNIGSLVPSLEFSLPWSGTQWINLAALLGAGRQARELARI